jgi:hypothetical protein
MNSRVAAVFTLGNTHGGCEYALRWIAKECGDSFDVYFLYGKPFPGQPPPTPLDAWSTMRGMPEFARLGWEEAESTAAASIDASYHDAMKLIRRVNERGYARVYIGITGGTNAMVATLFHAAMTELQGEVVPLYVQGKQDVSIELFEAARTRERIVVDRVLDLFRSRRVQAAKQAAAELSGCGRSGFVKDAVTAFAAWDGFDYQTAATLFERLKDKAEGFEETAFLSPVARAVRTYGKFARKTADLEACYRDPDVYYQQCGTPGFLQKITAYGYLLPTDALANAYRRLEEGLETDAVLRAYRAVEIAVQSRLFARGVHPARVRWDLPPVSGVVPQWRDKHGEPPKEVSFERALQLLELLSGVPFQASAGDRLYIQNLRNHSYLEHGYVRVKAEAARSCAKKAEALCGEILGRRIELNSMRFWAE